MATIAAVMIIRDEAEMLPVTLPPLVQALDQVVVVDMRSEDNSRAICRSLLRTNDVLADYDPLNLYSFGFEHPRNYGAQYTDADWILAIDADEFVDAGELMRLKNWVGERDLAELSCVSRRNYHHSEELSLGDLQMLLSRAGYSREEQGRFYRNDPSIRWAGLIHEEVWGPERLAGCERGFVPLTLHHLSHFKTSAASAADHKKKTLLYAYLLAKAYRYPSFRFGTNPFWFETYMRDNGAEMIGHANELAQDLGLENFEDMVVGENAMPAFVDRRDSTG